MADMLPDDTNSKQLAQYQQTVRELQAVLAAKLDRATHEVLLRATDLQDAETFNLQRVFRSQDEQHTVALCLWGNLTPNTRYVPTLFSLSLSLVSCTKYVAHRLPMCSQHQVARVRREEHELRGESLPRAQQLRRARALHALRSLVAALLLLQAASQAAESRCAAV